MPDFTTGINSFFTISESLSKTQFDIESLNLPVNEESDLEEKVLGYLSILNKIEKKQAKRDSFINDVKNKGFAELGLNNKIKKLETELDEQDYEKRKIHREILDVFSEFLISSQFPLIVGKYNLSILRDELKIELR